MQVVVSFLSGLLFASGLAISGMTQPGKVVGFLDITGHWDPTLAFVMGGALALYTPFYRLVRRRSTPVFGDHFDVPNRKDITWQLVTGASIFGIGWGLVGFCPAPVITALPAHSREAIAVTVGIVMGIVATRLVRRWLSSDGEAAMLADA